jgi:arylsulfatase A
MTRRSLLRTIAASPALAAQKEESRPNVVLILTDDQGSHDLGCYGNPHIATPNIDRLAKEGVRFTQFYCSPVCSPSRAALMTGRHYQRTGAVDTYKGRDTLDAREVTMGQVFQTHGYRTACIGKWHLGRYMRYHPNNRGFDTFFGFWQYGFINRYDDSDEVFEGSRPVETTGYITDVLTRRAIHFVNENRSRPFFLYLPYNAPHSPYLVPDNYIEPYLAKGIPLREARIYGMVTCIDKNVGRLLKTIDDAGLEENTIVLFMSDNGGVSRHFKAGLRDNKGSVYEGGVRAPLVVRWPGRVPAGASVDAICQHIDLLPTLCELTGVSAPDRDLDGRSLASHIRTGKGDSPHRYIYSQWNRGRPVLETVPGDPELKANWAIRDVQGFKLHHNGELYDLRVDPGEKRNISPERPEVARKLRHEFEEWFRLVTDREYARVPIEIGRDDENPVEIDLTWGDPVGKVTPQYRSYNRDTIDNWTDTGDSVRWKVDVMESGEYELILSYGCDPGQGGSIAQFQLGQARLDYTFTATPGRLVFMTRKAGRMSLGKGPATLEIKPLKIAGKELAAIHKIWFRRLREA